MSAINSASRLPAELIFSSLQASRVRSAGTYLGISAARSLRLGAQAAAKRSIDLCLVALLTPLALAPGAWILLRARWRGACAWTGMERFGRQGHRFTEFRFDRAAAFDSPLLSRIPALWNIARGDMSFVGPRPVSPGSEDLAAWVALPRHTLRPGLLSLWWVRRKANMAFDTEPFVDREYLGSWSNRGDLSLLLRALVLKTLDRRAPTAMPGVVQVAGIPIANLTMAETIDRITGTYKSAPSAVYFVNAHCVNVAIERPPYGDALRRSSMNLADGIGMRLASRMLGSEIRENVNGTDLFPRLCESLARSGDALYLLGARPGIAAEVAAWAQRSYPELKIAGVRDGFFGEPETPAVLAAIRESGASVLLVAMGVPNQELWIDRYLDQTGARVALGVGGLFDFYSGRIPRAPLWMRELGLEWIYRFLQEPVRLFRRYFIGNFVFLWRVIVWGSEGPGGRKVSSWIS